MAVERYQFEPARSTVGFSVRHLMVTRVPGRFTRFSGTLLFDPDAPERSSVTLEVETASFTTGQDDRDAAVRSADFLDVRRFPKLAFRSTAIRAAGRQRFTVEGELTVRDVTRPVRLEVEGPKRGDDRLGFTARGTISRKDFALSFGPVLEAGGVTVADKVELQLELEATRSW